MTLAKCLVVQHLAPERTWAIGDALVRAGVDVDTRRSFASDPLPDGISGYDGLVVMGGPMSALSDEDFESRKAELSLLADALDRRVPTIGVCLGAQLLALAGGGQVYRGRSGPEIGWAPVQLHPEAHEDPLFKDLPRELTVLHWHGDTFDLPTGATLLASNSRYANQAFRLGDAAWGMQFHMEVTEEAVELFIGAFEAEAGNAPGGATAIRRDSRSAIAALTVPRNLAFDRFGSLVASGTDGRDAAFTTRSS